MGGLSDFSECSARAKTFGWHSAVRYISGGYISIARKSIAHRDVKLENILVADQVGGLVGFLLGDFGFAKVCSLLHGCITFVGTPECMAPELYAARYGAIEYGFEADIWSFGVAFYMFASGTNPWHEGPLEPQICCGEGGFDELVGYCMSTTVAVAITSMTERRASRRLRLPFPL